MRYLGAEGLLAREEGELRRAGDEALAGRIPEGLRDVIGKRMARLSEQANQVLSVAAVIGRDFSLDVLQRVLGRSEEELFEAIREALATVVVEERMTVGALVSYRFTHAFFRQTLYEEMIAPERIRLHQQVARALEETYADEVEAHASELAEHSSYSSDPTNLSKAVENGGVEGSGRLVGRQFLRRVNVFECQSRAGDIPCQWLGVRVRSNHHAVQRGDFSHSGDGIWKCSALA